MTDELFHNYILVDRVPVAEPDLVKWALWFGRADRHVGQTEIGASVVSTVFIGVDHRHGRRAPPLLFETMVFTDGEAEDYQERCSTWLEAEQQHVRAVARVRERG